MSPRALPPSGHGAGWHRGRAWFAVAVFTLAYVVSIVDRQVLTLLVEPVQRDLQLNDTAFGVLHGVAFGLFYALVGLPIARLADRANRRNLILAGVFLWSLATAACGLARSFVTLFLARMGVGVGEAALTPAVLSILADVFPRDRLATPVSLYTMGAFWGTGLAYLLGAAVVGLIAQEPLATVPVIGSLPSWQLTFFVVSFPGLLLLPLILAVPEPRRREILPEANVASGIGSEAYTTALTAAHRRALFALYAGFSLLVLVTTTTFAWTPALFGRRFGWSAADIGYAFGLVLLVAGTAGIALGGALTDRLVRRGRADAPVRIGVASFLVLTVLVVLVPNASGASAALLGYVPLLFVLAFPAGAGMAAIQLIVPNRQRARMAARFILSSNLTAMLLGPPLVGLCTDFLFVDPLAIGAALSLVCGTAALGGAAILAWGIRHYRDARGMAAGNDEPLRVAQAASNHGR